MPELLLSQTCGYPLTTRLAGRVHYVATPCYRAPGCEGPRYSSMVVVRESEDAADLADMRGRRAAYNSQNSQSGYNSLRALVAPLAAGGHFFSATLETGAHRASVAAVRHGTADLAAIDAVSFALLQRDLPAEVTGLRVLARTESAPGLPLVTARQTTPLDIERLRSAWAAACVDPALATTRAGLLLDGFEVLDLADYDVIPAMRDCASAAGYPILA